MDLGVEPGGGEFRGPEIVGFLVEFAGVAVGLIRRVDGGVEAFPGKFPDLGDEFPGPFDGFLLEVIAETPVAEHFEEGVVIGIEANVFEVVMLAAGADAFLGIGGAGRGVGAVNLAEEDGDELVHARVGEQQVGRIGHEAGGRHDGVALRFEKIEEVLPDLAAGADLRRCRHVNLEAGTRQISGSECVPSLPNQGLKIGEERPEMPAEVLRRSIRRPGVVGTGLTLNRESLGRYLVIVPSHVLTFFGGALPVNQVAVTFLLSV